MKDDVSSDPADIGLLGSQAVVPDADARHDAIEQARRRSIGRRAHGRSVIGQGRHVIGHPGSMNQQLTADYWVIVQSNNNLLFVLSCNLRWASNQ